MHTMKKVMRKVKQTVLILQMLMMKQEKLDMIQKN